MNYFDLHCDTAFEMYKTGQGLAKNDLSVSLDHFDAYEKKAQVFAIWSDNTKSADVVYGDFFEIMDNLKNEIEKNCDRAVLCCDRETLTANDTRLKVIPAVEGACLIEKDLSRLEMLREYGVRILTVAWGGMNDVCGAFDTETGLSDFGVKVVEECEKLGILLDVSHLSEKGFFDLANVAKKPFLATHSNARALCDHPRNLSDIQLRTLSGADGLVGATVIGKCLSKSIEESPDPSEEAVMAQFVKHIVHLIEKCGEKKVALGCDFDGTRRLAGVKNVSDVKNIASYMQRNGASAKLTDDVFYGNAYRFFENNLQ